MSTRRTIAGILIVAYLSATLSLPALADGPTDGDTIQLITNDAKTRTVWVSAATYSVNRSHDYSRVLLTDLLIDYYRKHPDTNLIQV